MELVSWKISLESRVGLHFCWGKEIINLPAARNAIILFCDHDGA